MFESGANISPVVRDRQQLTAGLPGASINHQLLGLKYGIQGPANLGKQVEANEISGSLPVAAGSLPGNNPIVCVVGGLDAGQLRGRKHTLDGQAAGWLARRWR
jgi:hypothetical protein